MTREYRARLAAGGGPPPKSPTFAVVRVRLPEGLLLQGEFNAGEPVRRPPFRNWGWLTSINVAGIACKVRHFEP